MSRQRTVRANRGLRWRAGLILLLATLGLLVCGVGVGQARIAQPEDATTGGNVANISQFASITCAPGTSLCVAIGDNNTEDGNTNELVVVDDGVPGPVITVPELYLIQQVACSSATSCVIAGTDGFYTSGALLPFTLDSAGDVTFASVEDVPGSSSLAGVACPSTSECVADGFQYLDNNTNSVGVTVDVPGGASGTPGPAQDVASVVGAAQISCNSPSRCLADGSNPEFSGTGDTTTVLPISLPGASAGTPEPVSGIGFLEGVSCIPGTSTCEVVGYGSGANGGASDAGAAVAITGTTEGPTETSPDILDGGVSCPTASDCVGVGAGNGNPQEGIAEAFAPNSPIGSATADPNTGDMEAVECQSDGACLEAGADHGDAGDIVSLPLNAPTAPLSGTITLAGTASTDVANAPVQACATDGTFCIDGSSGSGGGYSLTVPVGEAYVVTAFSPSGSDDTQAASPATATLTANGLSGVDVALEPKPALDSGVSVNSPEFGGESSATAVPTVNWGQSFTVHIPASAFPSDETTTVETLVITGTNTATDRVQSVTVYAGGETTTAAGQSVANGLVVGPGGVDITVPPLSPIHGPVSLVVNSFSVPVPPTGVAGEPDPVLFTQGSATQQPAVVATDFGVDHTVGVPTISGPDAATFSLNSPASCAPQSTIVQQSAADPGSDQSCDFSVTWTPPANVATPPQPYYYATLSVPVTNSSGNAAELQIPLVGCDERVVSATLCQQQSSGGDGSDNPTPPPSIGTPVGSLYVDPSGLVETTTPAGVTVPLSGATVTLSQLGANGSYSAVPNGSDVMSASNRVNPATTGADGGFGWETLAGTYEISASDSACTNTATSAPETVPPPATGIALVLSCPGITQTSTTTSPGADPSTASPGQPVDLSATVTGDDPTGTVTLSYAGTTLATVPLDASTGVASYATSALPPGQDVVTVSYGGDSANAPSHAQETVTVQAAAQVPSTTSVTATPAMASPGGAVTYSATVTPGAGSADPTGTVTFTATSPSTSTALCSAQLQGATATCSSGSAPDGADTITASYGGDTNFAASTATTTVTVSAPTTSPIGPAPTTSTGAGTSPPATVPSPGTTGTGLSTTPLAPTPTSVGPSITSATIGNERITLETLAEGVCTAPSGTTPVSFATMAVTGSRAPTLSFVSAAVFLDRGLRRVSTVRRRVTVHGRTFTRSVRVVSYAPNVTLRKASDVFSLSDRGLTPGAHALKVIVSYHEVVSRREPVRTDGRVRTRTVKRLTVLTREVSTVITVC